MADSVRRHQQLTEWDPEIPEMVNNVFTMEFQSRPGIGLDSIMSVLSMRLTTHIDAVGHAVGKLEGYEPMHASEPDGVLRARALWP